MKSHRNKLQRACRSLCKRIKAKGHARTVCIKSCKAKLRGTFHGR